MLALVFLVSHALSLGNIKVDNTTIILLMVIMISPFVSAIKKIKFGDFEAEIDPEEVRRIKEEVETKMAEHNKEAVPPSPAIRSTIKAISLLSNNDSVLALAKLRMEIEKIVSNLYRRAIQNSKRRRRVQSLGKMINELMQNKLLPPDIVKLLREVISICNRAVHGEDIRSRDVESIIDTGAYLLEMLYFQSKSIVLGEEPESIIIDPSVVDEYRQVRYRLTTVIPYAEDSPVQNVRILDQEGLDAFFEDYDQFAEFIVDLRKIEK
ncbi:MAG: DUF4145 domain-containing protein [Elusimicrobia bacterium]|nr:DUF4145 domain-containing protein [Elusimicrobiota bacterium]